MTLIVKTGFNGMTDADAIAYVNAVEAADDQLLEFGVGKAINDFVVGCKLDGTWSAIKASCILAGARTLTGALVPLVGTAPTNFNFVSGDYNRKTGLVGDGSTKYLDSNRAQNVEPQNNIHLSAYVSQRNKVSSVNQFIIGDNAFTSAGSLHIVDRDADTGSRMRAAAFNGGGPVMAAPTLFGATRDNASSYTRRVNSSSEVVTQNSDGASVFSTRVFPSATNARIAFYSIGESLDLALLDTRVTALITAFGVAIP
jgi:hypothetical protein